ncbi:hypothetical protein [Clostridium estertheticum]|uniref:hypothetical protein n=1 Tax=Clostridium estertheticum TaxID=238834 RepID=UPI001CF43617|nr:hypothetical protein [Clostridium estertheticum]MCB2360288.1 hypothetical protein [Clostridium estertheticum]
MRNSLLNKGKLNNKIIWELSRMEQFTGLDYLIPIRRFSKFLRLEVWNEITEICLYKVLVEANTIFFIFYKDLPFPNYELIPKYIETFKKIWVKYKPSEPTEESWDDIKWKVDRLITDIIIKKQWDSINPYVDVNNKEHFDKDLIEIFDDMFKNCVLPIEDVFTRNYKSIKHLYRGTIGIHDFTWLLPNPKYTKLNRWNPEGRCFVYAAIEDTENMVDVRNGIFQGDMVCLKELRAEEGEQITLGKLKFKQNIDNERLFDFSYNDISFSSIENQVQNEQQSHIDSDGDAPLDGQIHIDEVLGAEQQEVVSISEDVRAVVGVTGLKDAEVAELLKVASNDATKVIECHKYSVAQENVKDIFNYTKWAIKNNKVLKCKKEYSAKGMFNAYPQRIYDFDKLEKALLYGEQYELPA